jgi:putative nucleotidyltransferase with HDIG domain
MATQLFSLDEAAQPGLGGQTKRILFVDEDPSFLDSLNALLRHVPPEWQISFRTAARDVLRELEGQDFDVIVTGERLSDMGARELLTEVLRCYPLVVRIAFCRGMQPGLAIRTANPAHQYLTIPFDAGTLRKTLETAFRIRKMLVSPRLKALISRINSLPSLPAVHEKLIASLNDPEISSRSLGEIIAQDVGLTAKILQITNSSFFGLYRYIATPSEAAVYLGVDTIRALTLSAGVFAAFRQTSLPRAFIEQLQAHSTMTGTVAGAIANAEGLVKRESDTSMVGGLLHDVGKLVLASNYPKEYTDVLNVASKDGLTATEAEQQCFGETHAEIGAYLLWLWGFPDPVCNAVAHHHQPSLSSADQFTAAGAIHVADALDHEAEDAGVVARMDETYLVSLGLDRRLPEWREVWLEQVRRRDEAGRP